MANLRNFDLNLLIIFEAIYTAGNISHASKKLNQSQPTISNSLTRLREVLNDPLFVRKGRGVEPTPKAISMIGHVREALKIIQDGVSTSEEFDPKKDRHHFRIVMLDLLEPILVPGLVRRTQELQNITLEMLQIAYEPILEGLADGSLDLVFSPHIQGAEEINQEPVGHAKTVMIARKGHPEINGEVTLEQYKRLGHLALIPKLRSITRVDEYLRFHGIERHIAYSTPKFLSFPHLISNTDLIAQVPGDFAKEAAKYYPLQMMPMPFEFPDQPIYMIWKANRTNDKGHRWLREQVREVYSEL